MKSKYMLFPLFIILVSAIYSQAQAWSGILNPTYGTGACTLAPSNAPAVCAIDWSIAGVGGIPTNRTQSGSTITCPGGNTDMTKSIQSALDSAANGTYVLLSAGICRINSRVTIPSNVTLRGAGADQTILSGFGSGGYVVSLGSGEPTASATSITSGASAGSTSIVVNSASGMAVGGYLRITEQNASWVSIAGDEGNCTWCDGYTNGTRARGQIVEITSISGSTVGITPPLYTAYTNSPQASYFAAAAKYAGAESLQIYGNNTGYTASVGMSACAYCWVKGIEVNYTDGDFVQDHWGYRDEIRDSYFSNSYHHTPGDTDSDIFIVNNTSASLVENNIIERAHTAIMLNWGAAGNVIAYNYDEGAFASNSTNWTMGGISMHGAHPQFNLLEGNVTTAITPDSIWGSNSHNTGFRNWIIGVNMVCNPMTGRGTVNCSGSNGWYSFRRSFGLSLARLSDYYNEVGNVAGSTQQQNVLAYGTVKMAHTPTIQYPTGADDEYTTYNMAWGYAETDTQGNKTPFATAFATGNYTYSNNATAWANGTLQLPPSFYLSGTPAWWPASVPFPAIGPDVTGQSGPGGHTVLGASNAAQNCYFNVMGGSDGGAASPLTFNANKCYGAGGNGGVNPPTNLKATVH